MADYYQWERPSIRREREVQRLHHVANLKTIKSVDPKQKVKKTVSQIEMNRAKNQTSLNYRKYERDS